MSVAFAFARNISVVNGSSNYEETSEGKKYNNSNNLYGMHYAYQKEYVTDIPLLFFCLPENNP